MKITLIIDIELTSEQETVVIVNPDSFISDHIDIKGIEKNNYSITVVNTDLMPYNAYNFSKGMVDWLNRLKIFRLEDICNFTYAQIKGSQIRDAKKESSHDYREFMPKLINAMKKQNLKFKDIGIENLISFRELELSNRAINCLEYNGIFYMQDISFFTREDISHLRNMGGKTQNEIEQVMRKYDIWYKDDNK